MEFRVEGDRYFFTWDDEGVGIGFEHIKDGSDGLHAEISVQALNVAGKAGHLHWGRLNLSSTTARASLSKILATRVKGEPVDWLGLLEIACTKTAQTVREPAQVIDLSRIEPCKTELYAVSPLVTLHETNILYGDGGSGKSLLALALGMSMADQFEELKLPDPIVAKAHGPVLYLDYETCQDEQGARMQGLALGWKTAALPPIHYRPAYRALADEIATLRADVQRLKIQMLIVDSMGPACGGEPEKAETVLQFMNALRSLGGVTRLVISHVAKGEMEKKRAKIFGSVYARNLSRSCWEVRSAEEDGKDALALGLFHEKFNRGKRHKPLGVTFTWDGDKVMMSKSEPLDHPDLAPSTGIATRIRELLKAGPMSTKEIAEELDEAPNSVKQAIRRAGVIIPFGSHAKGGRGSDRQNQWTVKATEGKL